MSKRKATLAINNIKKSLICLMEDAPLIFDLTFKKLGVHKTVREHCYKMKLYNLNDLYSASNILEYVYSDDANQLTSLSRQIRKICKCYLDYDVNKADIDLKKEVVLSTNSFEQNRKKKSKLAAKKNETKLKTPLIDIIKKRTNDNCCLYLTFNELRKITEKQFIYLMKKQFAMICDFKLQSGRIKSWRDEYKQLLNCFIPIFKKRDKNILDFYIIFELKLPKFRTDLTSDEYVYADAVIVGNDGFVVLEFKQREVVAVDQFSEQAQKYVKRLRFHKIGKSQRQRYTYLVFTKEKEEGVWIFKDKDDYWYGNPKGIAIDLVDDFFESNVPYDDIEEWLNAGFKEKHRKY